MEGLRQAGWKLVTLSDVWGKQGSQNTEDVEWITYAGERQMIALTRDARVRYVKHEREAIEESACRVVCFPNGNLPVREYIERINDQRRHVEALWAEPGPWLAKVYTDRVEITWRPDT